MPARSRAQHRIPAHPVFARLPMPLLAAAGGVELAGQLGATVGMVGAWLLVAAWLAAWTAAVSGLVARVRLPIAEGPARDRLRTHLVLGPLLLGALTVLVIWRAGAAPTGVAGWSFLGGIAVAIALAAVQGRVGGTLTYRHGLGVGGHFRVLPGAAAHAVTGATDGRPPDGAERRRRVRGGSDDAPRQPQPARISIGRRTS